MSAALLCRRALCHAHHGRVAHCSSTPTPVKTSFDRVRVVEVGPRDGLQNESTVVSTDDKVALIDRLSLSGLTTIEATSFVSPKWVPQMGDGADVMRRIARMDGVKYPVLVPNVKGLEAAIAVGATEVAVFAAASEAFSQKNINCSVDASLDRFTAVCARATEAGLSIRGYVSCVIACPYDGVTDVANVEKVTSRLFELGCYEVSLGDTIGVGSAGSWHVLLTALGKRFDVARLAIHAHDTYGQAMAAVLTALEHDIRVVDSSTGGLGGCPYAAGASGNVATEDVVYMMHDLGLRTGVSLSSLIETSVWMNERLGRVNNSKVSRAALAKRAPEKL